MHRNGSLFKSNKKINKYIHIQINGRRLAGTAGVFFKLVAIARLLVAVKWATEDPSRRHRCHAEVVGCGRDDRVHCDADLFSCASFLQHVRSNCRIRRRRSRRNFPRNYVVFYRCNSLRVIFYWKLLLNEMYLDKFIWSYIWIFSCSYAHCR